MTRRRKAIGATHARLEPIRVPTYKPSPISWKGLAVGAAVVGLLAILTAPRSER